MYIAKLIICIVLCVLSVRTTIFSYDFEMGLEHYVRKLAARFMDDKMFQELWPDTLRFGRIVLFLLICASSIYPICLIIKHQP